MMHLLPVLLFAACAPETSPVVPELDRAVVHEALAAARSEPLVELADGTAAWVPAGQDCPAVTVDSDGALVWEGGCVMPDGTEIEGRLEHHEDKDSTWVSGDSFQVLRGGELDFMLDGAIELRESDDLLLVDAAATTCGGPGTDCTNGPATVDLSYTIYPASGWPDVYDITVSGVVRVPVMREDSAPVSVEGTWRVDARVCASEPLTGTVAVRQHELHIFEPDGNVSCDGCAGWSVLGQAADAWCDFEL